MNNRCSHSVVIKINYSYFKRMIYKHHTFPIKGLNIHTMYRPKGFLLELRNDPKNESTFATWGRIIMPRNTIKHKLICHPRICYVKVQEWYKSIGGGRTYVEIYTDIYTHKRDRISPCIYRYRIKNTKTCSTLRDV